MMGPFAAMTGYAAAIIVFGLGLVIVMIYGHSLGTGRLRSFLFFCWHTLFCFVYAKYVNTNGGDALAYYAHGSAGNVSLSVGSKGIDFICEILVRGLGFSFIATSLFFSIFGAIGLIAFDASLQVATIDKNKWVKLFALLIVLLPSVSFWSAGLGKDAIAFMAAGLALWAAIDLGRRVPSMTVAVVAMLFVRPHMAAMLVLAMVGSVVVSGQIPLWKRILLGIVSLGAAAAIIPFALNYVGLDTDLNGEELAQYVSTRASYNTSGAGSVDLSSMSFPMQVFTYLFRPMPYEASGISSLAASVDNVILLGLFVIGTWKMILRERPRYKAGRSFLWLYSLGSWVILAVTTANLGISLRQKWMFAPMLIYLLISYVGKPRRAVAQPDLSTVGESPHVMGPPPSHFR